jgi:hypothetical protein
LVVNFGPLKKKKKKTNPHPDLNPPPAQSLFNHKKNYICLAQRAEVTLKFVLKYGKITRNPTVLSWTSFFLPSMVVEILLEEKRAQSVLLPAARTKSSAAGLRNLDEDVQFEELGCGQSYI